MRNLFQYSLRKGLMIFIFGLMLDLVLSYVGYSRSGPLFCFLGLVIAYLWNYNTFRKNKI